MDKVIVTCEVASAMDSAFKKYTFRDAMTIHVNSSWGKQHKCLNQLSVEDMARAYLIGYEDEQLQEFLGGNEVQASERR